MNLLDIIIDYLQNYLDRIIIKKTDFNTGKEFEKVAQELGI